MSCCLYLRGEFFIRNSPHECPPFKDACNPKLGTYRKIGNTSSCQVTINSEIIGSENQFNRVNPKNRLAISSVNLNLQIECANKENLLLAFGSVEKKIETESFNERILYCGKDSIAFLSMPPRNLVLTALSVYGEAIATLSTDDYSLRGSRVTFLNVPEDTRTILASYDTNVTASAIELKDLTPKYHEIFFDGYNVEDNRRVELRIARVLFTPVAESDFISKENFFSLPLQGVVEKSNQGFLSLMFIGDEDGSDESVIY